MLKNIIKNFVVKNPDLAEKAVTAASEFITKEVGDRVKGFFAPKTETPKAEVKTEATSDLPKEDSNNEETK